jgi:hypothetical protein
MPTTIKIDKHAVQARIMGDWQKALPVLTEQILNDCNQYVKWDTGMLAQSSYTHSDFKRGVMVWQTPYARRQYWEIRTAYRDMNPKATWKWVHAAKAKHYKQWTRQAAALMGAKT